MNLICLEHHFKGEVGNWVKSAYLEVFRCTPLFHQHPSTSHFFCCTIQPALNILNQPDDLNHSIGASVEATVMFGLSLLIAVDVIHWCCRYLLCFSQSKNIPGQPMVLPILSPIGTLLHM